MNYADALANALRLKQDIGTGFYENAASLASGMGASALGGLGGLGELVAPTSTPWSERLRRAADKVEKTQERFTYMPRSDVGERGLGNIGSAIETATKPVMENVVDPIGEKSPLLGATIITAANMVGPKGKPKVPKVPKPTVEGAALAARLRDLDARIAARRGELAEVAPDDIRRPAGEAGLQQMLREREQLTPRSSATTPQYDPGSPQQLIPGIEPHTLDQAHGIAQDAYARALRDMTFNDMNRGLRFEYDPEWTGSALGASQRQPGAWDVNYKERRAPNPEGGPDVYWSMGKRPAREIRGSRVFRRDFEDPNSPRVTPDAFDSRLHGNLVRDEIGAENQQQMLERLARLRDAEREAMVRGEEAAITRARDLNARINRHQALLQEPGISEAQRLTLEEELLGMMRQRPVNIEGRTYIPHPGEGLMSPIEWRNVLGHSELPPENHLLQMQSQARIVRRLRGEPEEPVRQPRRAALQSEALDEVSGRDPNAMNREAVDAFINEARSNPELLKYGLAPGPEVRSLEDFARHFSRKSGEDISVDWTYADSDEPSKIKVEKTHGRGEVMRDRYGDYKLDKAEEGQVKYDDYGDPVTKTKEIELHGPLPKGEEGPLIGYKEIEKTVPEGEPYRTEEGNYALRKSRGGEPVRDERGRIKERWEDNPDYNPEEENKAVLSTPKGEIDIRYGDPAYMGSLEGSAERGKKGAGELLYQTALAHASREGIHIDTSSLTDINRYRLLPNVLSNIVRMGKNPRSVSKTASGRATPAHGRAKGPEVWRAEAEEARSRLLHGGADPDRVKFDPEKGFSIDGKPASADDIAKNLAELSPNFSDRRGHLGGVGQKSLMRNAVFEWLRHATPEQAAAVAKKWPKEWGPLFAGIAALGVGVGAMQEEPQTTE